MQYENIFSPKILIDKCSKTVKKVIDFDFLLVLWTCNSYTFYFCLNPIWTSRDKVERPEFTALNTISMNILINMCLSFKIKFKDFETICLVSKTEVGTPKLNLPLIWYKNMYWKESLNSDGQQFHQNIKYIVHGHKYSSPSIFYYIFHIKPHFFKKIF